MPKPQVLLIGAEENPALAIMESLARRGIAVHAASHSRLAVGFFSRYAYRRFLYPSPVLDESGFVDRIVDYLRRNEIPVTFVTGDYATFLICKHQDRLRPHTTLPLPDLPTFMKCRDKTATMKLAADLGVPTPRTFDPADSSIEKIAERVAYPVVLKPNVSDGARGISFPADRDELIRNHATTRERYGPCHVQEYIPQTGDQYKAELILDSAGVVQAWCVYHKIRYYPPSGGSSTLNRTVPRGDILDLAARFLRGIGWYGLGDCDFIEDPRDGVPKLMEVNPRFTRSIKIAQRAGVDFPYWLYRMTLGESIMPALDYRSDVYLRYLPADLMWFLRSSNRFRTSPGFFTLFARDLHYEILSWTDPGPTLAYMLASVRDLLSRERRRHRLR